MAGKSWPYYWFLFQYISSTLSVLLHTRSILFFSPCRSTININGQGLENTKKKINALSEMNITVEPFLGKRLKEVAMPKLRFSSFLPFCFVKVTVSRLAALRVKGSRTLPVWGFPFTGFLSVTALEFFSPWDQHRLGWSPGREGVPQPNFLHCVHQAPGDIVASQNSVWRGGVLNFRLG